MYNSTLIIIAVIAWTTILITVVSCNQPIKYPEGGYDYPEHITARDTDFYYLPLKKILSRKDSFNRATNFFPMSFFNEPNLSMGPGKEDVFRFIYAEALGGTIFIDLNVSHRLTPSCQ